MRIPIAPFRLVISAWCATIVGSCAVAQETDVLRARYARGEYAAILELIGTSDMPGVSAEVCMIQADCLQKTDDPAAALSAYDRSALRGYPHPDLYLNRGICKTSLGFYDEARHDLQAYISKRPRDAAGYYWLSTVEYYQMNEKACIRLLDQSIELDSTFAPAWFLRAACYSEQSKWMFALDDFLQAYRLDPKILRAKLYAAVILLDLEHVQSALEMLNELKLEGDDLTAEVMYYSAEARYRMHDLEGACMDWNEAAALGDRDSAENVRKICTGKSGKPRFKRRSYGAF